MRVQLLLAFLDVLSISRVIRDPRGKLKVRGRQFARSPQWLDALPELTPELVGKLAREILVVDVSLLDRPEGLGDIFR